MATPRRARTDGKKVGAAGEVRQGGFPSETKADGGSTSGEWFRTLGFAGRPHLRGSRLDGSVIRIENLKKSNRKPMEQRRAAILRDDSLRRQIWNWGGEKDDKAIKKAQRSRRRAFTLLARRLSAQDTGEVSLFTRVATVLQVESARASWKGKSSREPGPENPVQAPRLPKPRQGGARNPKNTNGRKKG